MSRYNDDFVGFMTLWMLGWVALIAVCYCLKAICKSACEDGSSSSRSTYEQPMYQPNVQASRIENEPFLNSSRTVTTSTTSYPSSNIPLQPYPPTNGQCPYPPGVQMQMPYYPQSVPYSAQMQYPQQPMMNPGAAPYPTSSYPGMTSVSNVNESKSTAVQGAPYPTSSYPGMATASNVNESKQTAPYPTNASLDQKTSSSESAPPPAYSSYMAQNVPKTNESTAPYPPSSSS